MTRSELLSVWGLALAVLVGTAAAQAQPAVPAPPEAHDLTQVSAPPAGNAPVVPAPFTPAVNEKGPVTHVTDGHGTAGHGTAGHGTAGQGTAGHGTAAAKDHPANGHGSGNAHTGNAHAGNAHGGEHGSGHAAHEEEDHCKFLVTGEFLLVRPRRREQDYAILGRNPNWGPQGVIKSVEGGYDAGGRFGLGYHFAGGFEVLFQYTHFHSAGDDLIPASQTAGGLQLFPTLTHPAIVGEVAAAKASNNVNVNLFDLELGKRWQVAEGWTVRGFVGPRFVNLDQKYTALYTGGDVTRDFVRRTLTFDGGGVRAGGEFNYHFWEFLGVYARSSATLMTGRFRSTLNEVADNRTIVNVSETYDKVVPVFDAGLGLSFQKGSWKVSVGYEFWNYFGMVEAIDFADDASPAKPNRRWADLGFDGVVVRAEMTF